MEARLLEKDGETERVSYFERACLAGSSTLEALKMVLLNQSSALKAAAAAAAAVTSAAHAAAATGLAAHSLQHPGHHAEHHRAHHPRVADGPVAVISDGGDAAADDSGGRPLKPPFQTTATAAAPLPARPPALATACSGMVSPTAAADAEREPPACGASACSGGKCGGVGQSWGSAASPAAPAGRGRCSPTDAPADSAAAAE